MVEGELYEQHTECLKRVGALNPERAAKLDVIVLQDLTHTELPLAEAALRDFVGGDPSLKYEVSPGYVESPHEVSEHLRSCLWSHYRRMNDGPTPASAPVPAIKKRRVKRCAQKSTHPMTLRSKYREITDEPSKVASLRKKRGNDEGEVLLRKAQRTD